MSQTRSPRSRSEERIEDGRSEPGWRDRLNQHPMAPYYLILGAAMLLLVLGLVMVLSSSGVESYEIYDSAFTLFSRQAMFAVDRRGRDAGHLPAADPRLPAVRAGLPGAEHRHAAAHVRARASARGVNGQRNWIRLVGPVPAAALGVRQARADPVVRGPLRPPGGATCTSGARCWCRSCRWWRWSWAWSSSRATWAPRSSLSIIVAGAAVRRRCADADLRRVRRRGPGGHRRAVADRGLPHAALHRVAAPGGRPRRRRLAAHPGQGARWAPAAGGGSASAAAGRSGGRCPRRTPTSSSRSSARSSACSAR